jgi:hypothetical protein
MDNTLTMFQAGKKSGFHFPGDNLEVLKTWIATA